MAAARIKILNEQTINKIAAGEVIENPSSVVKELVENAIDADSKTISVQIQGGGRDLIRITDDGFGMSRDDALLCLERHATSKIREVEDIQNIFTMGFRGEAIPSIASISKFQLLTSPRTENKSLKGTLIKVEGGRTLSCVDAERSPGTTIEIKSLFFNVPVRRKFQRSPIYDTQEILKMIGNLALANPFIQFELISDQKRILNTKQVENSNFQERLKIQIETVLGEEFAHELIPVEFNQNLFEFKGFIGSHLIHKPNKKGQHLFINQRLVYSPLIAHAIKEGYGTMLPPNRYPHFVVHLTIPGTYVDVNVHPQKKEVRLRNEMQIKEMVVNAVQKALKKEQKEIFSMPALPIEYSMHEDNSPFLPKVCERSEKIPSFWGESSFSPSSLSKYPEEKWEFQSTPIKKEIQPSLFPSTTQILGTLKGFLILDPFSLDKRLFPQEKKEGGLALLDQRNAFNRIYFEKLTKQTSKETQSLLFPLTLPFSSSESQLIQEVLEPLNQMGFGLREFGENTFLLDAIPLFLKEDQIQNCFEILIEELSETRSSQKIQMQIEENLALAAARASLPHTKRLTIEEGFGLIQQLLQCEIPSHCPKGKPICLYLEPEEITKWFQKNPMKS